MCEAIVAELGSSCLPFPSTVDEWKSIEREFRDRWNFPHCVGALDGKHVVIQACGQGSLLQLQGHSLDHSDGSCWTHLRDYLV